MLNLVAGKFAGRLLRLKWESNLNCGGVNVNCAGVYLNCAGVYVNCGGVNLNCGRVNLNCGGVNFIWLRVRSYWRFLFTW